MNKISRALTSTQTAVLITTVVAASATYSTVALILDGRHTALVVAAALLAGINIIGLAGAWWLNRRNRTAKHFWQREPSETQRKANLNLGALHLMWAAAILTVQMT